MNYEKNTIGWWLSRIADPVIREKALANASEKVINCIEHSISGAIVVAFYWRNSPEGNDYWDNLHDNPPALLDEPPTATDYRQAIIELLEADKDNPFLPAIHREGLRAIIRKGGAD